MDKITISLPHNGNYNLHRTDSGFNFELYPFDES